MNATSFGAPLRNIVNSSYGYVLSIYDRTLNLILSGRLVTVSSSAKGRGPFIINVAAPDDFSFRSLNLLEGSFAECSSKRLRLNETKLTVNIEQAQQYDASINIKAYDKTKLSANLELAAEVISNEGSPFGLREILRCLKGQSNLKAGDNVTLFALPYVRRLLSAIKSKNLKEMSYCLEHLIGLGPGTTPSCDDMLCGMMLAMKGFPSSDIELHSKAELFCSLARNLSAGRTNIISGEYILYASFGQANEVVASALESLFSKQGLMQKFKQLLAIGESSGTDIAVGLVLGTELCLDNQQTKIQYLK